MYPQLNTYLDGSPDPVVIEMIADDLWTYDELCQKEKRPTSEIGLRLTVAYCHIEGHAPKSLIDVKAWARAHNVQVTLGDVDPTQPEVTADS